MEMLLIKSSYNLNGSFQHIRRKMHTDVFHWVLPVRWAQLESELLGGGSPLWNLVLSCLVFVTDVHIYQSTLCLSLIHIYQSTLQRDSREWQLKQFEGSQQTFRVREALFFSATTQPTFPNLVFLPAPAAHLCLTLSIYKCLSFFLRKDFIYF